MTTPLRIVVLVSGEGTNLQAIIDAARTGALPVEISAVISNRPDARGLDRARQAGIPTRLIDHTAYPDRAAFDGALRTIIDQYHPALVVLAGFMRILGEDFVDHYRGRLINIHPSLLPAFPGLGTHRRALAAGVREHGASVHFVTNEVDGGPIIARIRVPVQPGDDIHRLAARVLQREHALYVTAIRWIAQGRLKLVDGVVCRDGRVLSTPIDFDQAVEHGDAP
jgi:phosphoribosylglycinamide formyltransferase-1